MTCSSQNAGSFVSMSCKLAVLAVLCVLGVVSSKQIDIPKWLKLGTASSSYQVEGAWNVSDKGESIWDRFVHDRPHLDNGDVAADSYHLWRRDVEMLDELGADFYRFSISWPRLLPEAYPNYISEDGAKYYSDLIDALLEKGIEPVVTIHHWEMPQVLQDKGGWTNPLIADWFADYARVVFTLYGDRVKTFITINEPLNLCDLFHGSDIWAPAVNDGGHSDYLCNKHLLLAHARAWRLYDEEFRSRFGGKLSIGNFMMWFEPYSDEDKDLAHLAMEYANGRYYHPIYSKEGGWPQIIESYIEEKSLQQGYTRSRLPRFSQEEIELIRGTYDYVAMNHYTSRLVRAAVPGERISNLFFEGIRELEAVMEISPDWELSLAEIIPLHHEGIRYGVAWFKEKYGSIETFISETGFVSEVELEDEGRSRFIDRYLEQLMLIINEDKVNMTGFTYWSLMDSYEWSSGYSDKMGLFHVDFSSPERTRTPRSSVQHYSNIIKNRIVELPDDA